MLLFFLPKSASHGSALWSSNADGFYFLMKPLKTAFSFYFGFPKQWHCFNLQTGTLADCWLVITAPRPTSSVLIPSCEMFLQESKQNYSCKKEQANKVWDWVVERSQQKEIRAGTLSRALKSQRGRNPFSQKRKKLAHLSHHFHFYYTDIN